MVPEERKPKIAVVVTSVLMVQFFLVPHLEALSKKYEVTLLLKNDQPEILASMRLPCRVVLAPIERKIHLLQDLYGLWFLAVFFWREKFDLVHALTPKAGLLGMAAAWLVRVPIRIFTFQGEIWANRTGLWRWILRSLDKLIGLLATHITVVSHTERSYLINEGIIAENKSCVLGGGSIGGVDHARFIRNIEVRQRVRASLSLKEQDVLFLYVGRLNTEKGLLELGDAFKQLADERDDVHLLIVGPDEEDIRVKLAPFESGLGQKIIFQPYTPRPEDVMSAADVLVLPSHREGFGVVIIEAGAAGIPAIGSDIYGIQDAIVDGYTGLLFKRSNVDDLLSKMRLLTADRPLREALGRQAATRVAKEFDQQILVKAFVNYYSDLTKASDSHARI